MTFSVVSGSLSAAVAASSGTFVVSYPSGKDEGAFYKAIGHKLTIGQNGVYLYPKDFDITLGTADITVTNKTTGIWPAGDAFRLQLEEPGERQYRGTNGQLVPSTTKGNTVLISLGAPDTIDADGIAASQNRTGAGALLVNGALAASGVATLDVPRNVVVDSGGADTAVITVTGTDVYGKSLSEAITLNGATAVAGKKAFKTITALASDATIANGFFAGPGDVLGLPVFVPAAGFIVNELEDGIVATAGTFVAGIVTAGGSTTTTGDIRGTYDPNSAADGAKVFQLVVYLPDPSSTGALKQNLDTSASLA